MLRRIGSFVALLLVATFVLAACGTQDDTVEPTVTRIPVDVPTASTGGGGSSGGSSGGGEQAGGTEFDVEMVDIAFSVKELTVPANTDITINLKNSGAAVHNFHITELNAISKDLAGGESEALTFNTGAPGVYEFFCAIPGHREAGMVGKITVADAAPAAEGDGGAAAGGDAASAQTAFPITMVDIAFEQKELTVPANTDISIELDNTGAAVHNFRITELNASSKDLASGEKETLTFNSGAPGEYEYFCAIPGHREAGMVGKLIVTASAEPAGGAEAPAASPEASPAATPADETAPPAAAAQTDFAVSMIDIAFEQKELTVPANTDITVNLTNTGFAVHNFHITELNAISKDLASGETEALTFNSGAPGEYQYFCAIPGHREAGMIGKLIVK